MRDLILKDVTRCRGSLLGENWGDNDVICHVREHCKLHIQAILDTGNKRDDVSFTGWACATDDKENFVPLEVQEVLL